MLIFSDITEWLLKCSIRDEAVDGEVGGKIKKRFFSRHVRVYIDLVEHGESLWKGSGEGA